MGIVQFYLSTEKYVGCFEDFFCLLILNPAAKKKFTYIFYVNLFLFL